MDWEHLPWLYRSSFSDIKLLESGSWGWRVRVGLQPAGEVVDIELRIENAARDHRLRMLFPVPGKVDHFQAATTFDIAQRTPGPCENEAWIQAAPSTFPQQGFVYANGLSVVAPGLTEAEVVSDPQGTIAITLLRCVGSLSRADLRSRPGPAGPGTDPPGAQCLGAFTARLSLFVGLDPARAREAELGLRAVEAGESFLAAEGEALIQVAPSTLLTSAVKPAEAADGLVLRLLNPTSESQEARVSLGFQFASVEPVRLDEQSSDEFEVARNGDSLRFSVPPHTLRTVLVN